MAKTKDSSERSDRSAQRRAFHSPETLYWEHPGPLQLELGGRLERVRVGYRTWGRLAPDGRNAVVVCHALTGTADVDSWWARMFGPGRAFDPDRDFVCLEDDLCPGTEPEAVPTVELGTWRFADVDGDGVFETKASKGKGPGRAYTFEETRGCSCTQIIAALELGEGHSKFGCSISAMDDWLVFASAQP